MMDFSGEFASLIEADRPDFDIRGLITASDDIYPLGTDTKVLSTAFELIARPFVLSVAQKHGLMMVEPTKQNHYPDFTLMRDATDNEKVAIDVKTTYRDIGRSGTWKASFTLGGYTSYIRSGTKNISFPFSSYAKHYIIGFVYTRRPVIQGAGHIYTIANRESISGPMEDIEYFVQEKYRIASDRPGSGNTTNIGSIEASSVSEFAKGEGPFVHLGESVFLDYWRNYGNSTFTRLSGYHIWRAGQGK